MAKEIEILKEKKRKQEDSQEEKKDDYGDMTDSIDNLITEIKSLVANNNKAGAIAKYSTIQEIYKQIPKEHKAQILAKCLEAQKIISGK